MESMIERMYPVPMNLQLFAEPASDPAPPETEAETAPEAAKEPEQKLQDEPRTFTQADIDKIINRTIAKERAERDKAIAEARTEGEKLAKMTADQKAEHERQEALKKLEERERIVSEGMLRLEAHKVLTEKGLPPSLIDVLNFTDADACNASIEILETVYRAAVQQGVKDAMRGTAPKAGSPAAPAAPTGTASERIKQKTAMMLKSQQN